MVADVVGRTVELSIVLVSGSTEVGAVVVVDV